MLLAFDLICDNLFILVGVSTLEPSHLNFLYEADEKFIPLPTFATSISLNAVYEKNIFQEAISKYNLEDNLIRVSKPEYYRHFLTLGDRLCTESSISRCTKQFLLLES